MNSTTMVVRRVTSQNSLLHEHLLINSHTKQKPDRKNIYIMRTNSN